MKHSYTGSLITLAAAVTQASRLYTNKNKKSVTGTAGNNLIFLKLVTHNQHGDNTVGIKFDNILAGKYFLLTHAAQQQSVVKKEWKTENKILADSWVTTENE